MIIMATMKVKALVAIIVLIGATVIIEEVIARKVMAR